MNAIPTLRRLTMALFALILARSILTLAAVPPIITATMGIGTVLLAGLIVYRLHRIASSMGKDKRE